MTTQYVTLARHVSASGTTEQAFGPFGSWSDADRRADELIVHYERTPHLFDGQPSTTHVSVITLTAP